MDSVQGEVALVTGGAQGIGLGIARALAGAGASVVLVDIDEGALRAAEAELSALTTVATAVLDVRDRLEWLTVVEGVETTLGPIGILCNNAGVAGRVPAAQMSYETWDWVLGINLGGVVNGLQTVLPRLVGRGRGHIVNTASGAGVGIPGPGGGAGFLYHSSKYAVVGMSESLHDELAPLGIGVSVLCPGPVATNIQDTSPRTRPEGAPAPSAEFVAARKQLLAAGASPDDVGQRVLQAILADELYVHTDRIMEPFVRARAEAIVAAMPAP